MVIPFNSQDPPQPTLDRFLSSYGLSKQGIRLFLSLLVLVYAVLSN